MLHFYLKIDNFCCTVALIKVLHGHFRTITEITIFACNYNSNKYKGTCAVACICCTCTPIDVCIELNPQNINRKYMKFTLFVVLLIVLNPPKYFYFMANQGYPRKP